MRRFVVLVLIVAGIYGAASAGAVTSGAAVILAVIAFAVAVGPLRLARFLVGVAMMGRALGG